MCVFGVDLNVNLFVLEELLLGNVLEGVDGMGTSVLQCLPVVDLVLDFFYVLDDLYFPQLYLLLPPLGGIEPFVVLFEVETSVVQALAVVLMGNVLAGLVELLFALVQLLHLLVQPRQDYVLPDLRLRQHDVEHVLVRVYLRQ